ncbi:hypothetical protein BH09MYX1_BH09MYX1_54090 [soil metagenome]
MHAPRRLAFVFVACARTSPSSDGAVVLLPAPSSAPSAAAKPAASTAPRPPASGRSLAIIGGDLVDLGTVAPLHTLTTDLVLSSAVAGDTAYAFARGEIRAYDVETGALRWSRPTASCASIAATTHGVFCGDATTQLFDAATGMSHVIGAATPVHSIVELSGRVLVLHTDKKLESFDDAGVLGGTVNVPVMPDGAYARAALSSSGALSCGAQRNNVATLVFCIDASPKIVWQRTIPVASGLLVHSDDGALVLASDVWSKAISSEVLRPTDGTTLLHVPAVRLGAALTTAGVFDGALASEPDVALYDPHGTVVWRWRPPFGHDEGIRAVRVGSNIALALYSPIATGTQLFAVDATSGTLAWTANVDQLPIAHSKYSNAVQLDMNRTGMLLRGHESSQDYAQEFDPRTGGRTASVLRRR